MDIVRKKLETYLSQDTDPLQVYGCISGLAYDLGLDESDIIPELIPAGASESVHNQVAEITDCVAALQPLYDVDRKDIAQELMEDPDCSRVHINDSEHGYGAAAAALVVLNHIDEDTYRALSQKYSERIRQDLSRH